MAALVVVELFKAEKFVLQVASSPKGHEVEVLSPDCPDESLDERMGNRYVGYSFHFGYFEYSEVGFPPMEPEQWIMIATDVLWRAGPADRTVEHPTKRWPIHCARVYAETNNSTCALVHDDEHPMAFENEGFAAEKIDTPQAVFRVTEY